MRYYVLLPSWHNSNKQNIFQVRRRAGSSTHPSGMPVPPSSSTDPEVCLGSFWQYDTRVLRSDFAITPKVQVPQRRDTFVEENNVAKITHRRHD